MKFQIIISAFLVIASMAMTENGIAQDNSVKSPTLNGTWQPLKQEIGGKPLPNSVFDCQKLIINDSLYTVIAESVDKGVVKYSEGKLDIYGRNGVNTGKHFTAIYKIENEQLVICYDLSGKAYPESFETKSKPFLFLSVFKKNAN
jgi:uncharacterized protein (TIGR03067 family)